MIEERKTLAVMVGTVLKTERLARGMSQGTLSRVSGVTKSRISRYEHGHHLPTIDTLNRLARGMGTDLSNLLSVLPEDE